MSWFRASNRATRASGKRSPYQTPAAKMRTKRTQESFKDKVARWTELLKSSPLFLLGLVAVFLIFGIVLAVARRFFSPSQQVVVHQFEISPELAKALMISGNAVSDIVSDDANRIAIEGGTFSGLTPGSSSSHFGSIPKTVHIPVKTSVPLSIKGISLDDAIQIYDWLRYDQVFLSGDIYATDKTHAYIRMRVEGSGIEGSWVTPFDPSLPLEDTLRAESIRAMIRINPDLVGRMYLNDHDMPNALRTFAGWARVEPLNPLPYYFLAYIYETDSERAEVLGVPREDEILQSRLMATLASEIAGHRTICSHFSGKIRCYWLRVQNGLGGNPTPKISDRAMSSLADTDRDNGSYDSAYERYTALVKRYPADTNLQINLGVTAEGQGNLAQDSSLRRKKYLEALKQFQLAEIESPDNPLVERDIGAELSKIGNNDAAANYEETSLLLQPSGFQALRLAVIFLNGEQHYSHAADLCRTFFVLQSPDRSALAHTIYGQQDSNTWADAERQCAQSFVESDESWMDRQWIDFGEEVKVLATTESPDKSESDVTNALHHPADTQSKKLSVRSTEAHPAYIRK